MRITSPSLTRRLALGLAALASTPPSAYPAAAITFSQDTIRQKLSRVPVFVVTNSAEAPYLTEMDAQGRRSGFFYLGPQQAVAALNEIKPFDPTASLNIVSLDSIWFEASQTAEEVAQAPQPKAGTSTDLRLFRVRPLEDAAATEDRQRLAPAKGSQPLGIHTSLSNTCTQFQNPRSLRTAPAAPEHPSIHSEHWLRTARRTAWCMRRLIRAVSYVFAAADDIPLFYDTSFSVSLQGREQRPYFFRLVDLRRAYQEEKGSQLAEPPSIRVISLRALVRDLLSGKLPADAPPPLFVAASDASAVVERMGSAQPSQQSSASATLEARERPQPGDGIQAVESSQFFPNVPFAGGRKLK